jgi:hypothetical protein
MDADVLLYVVIGGFFPVYTLQYSVIFKNIWR